MLSNHLRCGLPLLLFPGTSITITLLPTYSSSLFNTCPYHFNLLSCTLYILISATFKCVSCAYFTAHLSAPYIIAGLTILCRLYSMRHLLLWILGKMRKAKEESIDQKSKLCWRRNDSEQGHAGFQRVEDAHRPLCTFRTPDVSTTGTSSSAKRQHDIWDWRLICA